MEYTKQDVLDHMGLVRKVAYGMRESYTNSLTNFDDLVSEGTLGLIRAFELFDPEKGAKFSTYARFKIRGRIQDARRELFKQHRWAKRHGLKPLVMLSLDQPLVDPDGTESSYHDRLPGKFIPETEMVEYLDTPRIWKEIWDSLNPKQLEVIGLMLLGLNQEEIAQRKGVTGAAISHHYKRAVAAARRHCQLTEGSR